MATRSRSCFQGCSDLLGLSMTIALSLSDWLKRCTAVGGAAVVVDPVVNPVVNLGTQQDPIPVPNITGRSRKDLREIDELLQLHEI